MIAIFFFFLRWKEKWRIGENISECKHPYLHVHGERLRTTGDLRKKGEKQLETLSINKRVNKKHFFLKIQIAASPTSFPVAQEQKH